MCHSVSVRSVPNVIIPQCGFVLVHWKNFFKTGKSFASGFKQACSTDG